jgi:Undecaprenyl-phosphate glucose phosphotransferase
MQNPAPSPFRSSFPFVAKVLPGLAVIADGMALLLAGYLSYRYLVFHTDSTVGLYAAAIVFNCLVTIGLLQFGGLYRQEALFSPISFADRIVIAAVTCFLLLLAAAFSIKQSEPLSRIWGASLLPSSLAALLIGRAFIGLALRRISGSRAFARDIVIAGDGVQLAALLAHIKSAKPRFVRIVGMFLRNPSGTEHAGYPVLGRFEDLSGYARQNRVDDIFLALPWSDDAAIMGQVERLRELPINVYLSSDLVGFRMSLKPPPGHFSALPISEVSGKPLNGWDVLIKSIEDYLGAALILMLLLPVFALVALCIKIDSKGPVLFRQKRLGFNNQPFDIFKFRSMAHHQADDVATVQATKGDLRVTRVGRFLRRASIDELPQLFNVLNGTMSLVGPRPHALDHNAEYAQKIRGYFARHRMKPGMTGLAQVKGFRGPTAAVEQMEARVKYDVEYTENWSFTRDLQIIARTIVVCIWGKNAV